MLKVLSLAALVTVLVLRDRIAGWFKWLFAPYPEDEGQAWTERDEEALAAYLDQVGDAS